MFWIYIVLLANGVTITQTTEEQKQRVERLEEVNSATHVFPYSFPDKFVTTWVDWTAGYVNKKPIYATIYESMKHDIHFYIFPPRHCQAVYFCVGEGFNVSENGIIQFDLTKSCSDSLRFFPLEQVVYHVENGKSTAYPYFSSFVEIIYQYTSQAQQEFIFKPYQDFDIEDIKSVQRGNDIKLSLAGRQILFLTSSPYCHATIQQPFGGVGKSHAVLFEPKNVNTIYNYAYYLGGGDEHQNTRAKTWLGRPSISFDPVNARNRLKKAKVDCCPPTWEFEGFVTESEWNTYSKITYQRYTLRKKAVLIMNNENYRSYSVLTTLTYKKQLETHVKQILSHVF